MRVVTCNARWQSEIIEARRSAMHHSLVGEAADHGCRAECLSTRLTSDCHYVNC